MRVPTVCWTVVLVLGTGCGREPAGPDTSDLERAPSRVAPRVLEEAQAEEQALRLVKEGPAPDGNGTNQDWINRQLQAAEYDAVFPHWEVYRRGAGRFEVAFRFIELSGREKVVWRGYSWTADVVFLTVSGPYEAELRHVTTRERRWLGTTRKGTAQF